MDTALFSSGGGFFASKLASGSPIYINVHSSFAPVVYNMLGFDVISVQSSRTLYLNMNIDSDNILEISSVKGIDYIRGVYLTVGQRMRDVCSQCQSYYAFA